MNADRHRAPADGSRSRRARPGVGTLRTVLGLAAAWAALACGSEPSGSPGDVSLGWSVDTVFTVGGADAPEWAAFGEATAVSFDDAGRLHVLDGQARRVVVVDGTGAFAGTVGAPGEGPGELRFPADLVVHGDGAVTVLDPGHGGFVVYDAGGSWLRTVPVDAREPGMPAGPLRPGPDGGLYAEADPQQVDDGPRPPTRPVVRFSDEAAAGHRVVAHGWRPPAPETGELDPEATGGLRVRLAPLLGFHPGLHVAPLPDGRLAVVDSFAYRIRLVSPEGGSERSLSRRIEPVTVTGALRDAERERRLREVMEDPARRVVSNAEGETAAPPSSAVQRLERARVDAMGFYDQVPVVTTLAVDRRGRIWVGRAGDRPGRPGPVDVLDPDRGYLGTLDPGLSVPDAFGPDGLAAWIDQDALGAATVRVGRIRDGG